MALPRRPLLIILGSVVALILLIALAIPHFLNGDAFRARIETALTASLGRKVLSRRAAGSVHHQSSAAKRSRNIGGLSCALWGVSQKREIIGKFPQETFIFLPRGWVLIFHAISYARGLGFRGFSGLELSYIYCAPFGVNYMQSGT